MIDGNYNASRSVIRLKSKVKILSSATVGGKKEKEGPLGKYLDIYCDKSDMGESSWEKAENEMCRLSLNTALSKAKMSDKNIDLLISGDLLNQCTGSGYGLEGFDIPYFGLYGACSTFAEGVGIAAMLIDGGYINTAGVVVSSHFCSAERQFRFPLEYGSFSGTTAQNTVTGAGAFILAKADSDENGVFIEEMMPGIVCDRGIKDASNMGAAMSSAAADTILRYLNSTGLQIDSFDAVATGDLGEEGYKILVELLSEKNIKSSRALQDCGMLIYDIHKQDVGCGGSGCGCSAICAAGYFYENLKNKSMKNVVLIGTGAMMSPQSLLQNLSIPSVAHLIKLSSY